MKLLLTSSGITNPSIEGALVEMMGKPIAEANALIVPAGLYPFPGGGRMVWRSVVGQQGGPLAGLPWKSMGILELSVLPSIEREAWVPMLEETDALLVGGGDVLFVVHWMRASGVADLLPSLSQMVYVGVSAGSIATAARFTETYVDPPRGTGEWLTTEPAVFDTPDGHVDRLIVTAKGLGLVDFAIIPHLDNPRHEDASLANAEIWASKSPLPTYAIDDQTAVKVDGAAVEVVTEGHWRLFNA